MIRNYLVGIVVVLGLFNLCSATERITRGFSPLGVDTYTTGESDALLAAKQDLLTSSTDVNVRNLDANSIDANDGNFINLTVNGVPVASANDLLPIYFTADINISSDCRGVTYICTATSGDINVMFDAFEPNMYGVVIDASPDSNLILKPPGGKALVLVRPTGSISGDPNQQLASRYNDYVEISFRATDEENLKCLER